MKEEFVSDELKRHLPIVIAVLAVGIVSGAILLLNVLNASSTLDVGTFSSLVFLVPCAIMVVCSFIIMLTAHEIGRNQFLIVTGTCFVAGLASMVVSSMWMSDATVAANLLANSPDGTTITPPVNSMVVVIRDIAAFIVAPTVGSILGAWIGSRVHPMKATGSSKRKGKR